MRFLVSLPDVLYSLHSLLQQTGDPPNVSHPALYLFTIVLQLITLIIDLSPLRTKDHYW